MNDYPIGATWSYTDESGAKGSVWLDGMAYGKQVWKWNFCYSDGSGLRFDWTGNKKSAIEECKSAFGWTKTKIIFKREKS